MLDSSSPWLAIADVDLTPGRGDALIRAAAPINEELALDVAAPWLVREERTGWVDGRLRSERVRRLGAIELSVTPASAPSPAAVADAVVAACREQGPGILLFMALSTDIQHRSNIKRILNGTESKIGQRVDMKK